MSWVVLASDGPSPPFAPDRNRLDGGKLESVPLILVVEDEEPMKETVPGALKRAASCNH